MLSPKTKNNIRRIIPFGLMWLVFSIVYSLLERGLLGELKNYPSTGNPYNFTSTVFVTPLAALIAGLLIGAIEVLYLNKRFIQKTFTQKIIYKTIVYLAMIVIFLFSVTLLANVLEVPTREVAWANAWAFFSSFAFWSVAVYIASMIGVSLFYSEVSDNLGQGVLQNFFTGKYHRPVEEERIFMFLDMKSSTTIAEHIGHIRYFEMLRTYFSDLSDPIINHSGEIYQYVGDEVVVSWKLLDGLHNNNCINCFVAMKAELKKQSVKYNDTFGVVPEFKAGLHLGKVTAGEIGVIKKEIIFTGDVLNTTARIQSLCNAFSVDILISEQLMKRLEPVPDFKWRALGETELRGRDEKIKIYTV